MAGLVLNNAARGTLLSLQNICGLQNVVSQRLSTGLKVNSALDNPSSFYTAQSLNNRASDLSALLDAMSQGIQTIKAAQAGLQTAAGFLQQAKAEAEQVHQFAFPVIARVSTEEELLAAIDSGKAGIIVLARDITLSTNQSIKLQDNQSLVGAGYLDPHAAKTSLSFNFSGAKGGISTGNNSLISDLNINYKTDTQRPLDGAIFINNKVGNVVQNVNINMASSSTSNGGTAAITVSGNSQVQLQGQVNIVTDGLKRLYGIYVRDYSKLDVQGTLNVKSSGSFAFNIHAIDNSSVNILSGSRVNFSSSDISVLTTSKSTFTVESGVDYSSRASFNFYMEGSSQDAYGGNTIIIKSNLNLSSFSLFLSASKVSNPNYPGSGNYFNIAAGVTISTPLSAGVQGIWQLTDSLTLISGSTSQSIKNNYLDTIPGITKLTETPLPQPDIDEEMKKEDPVAKGRFEQKNFNLILGQYKSLLDETSYKGINLLKNQSLTVSFNEDGSSGLLIAGVDASLDTLGIRENEWKSSADIETTILQLEGAIDQLRQFSAQLGNSYSILATRESFTNKLINVLEEGADKLTLADMNEESANALMLETRQNLAINALSLAAEASQAVLKLF